MREEFNYKTFLITLLLILPATAALGNHVDLPSTYSSPSPMSHSKQKTELDILEGKTPGSVSSHRSHTKGKNLHNPQSTPGVKKQKTLTTKGHTTLGWRYLLKGNTHAAIAAYKQALRQNPKSAGGYLGLGISLKHLGKFGLAKKAILKAVNLDPHLTSALVHLGYLYAEGHFGQTDLTTARRLFHEASQLGDSFASIALMDMKSHSKL